MGTPGKLEKKDFGYSMPGNAPLYNPFPVEYNDAKVLSITYVTDRDKAAAILPSHMELTDTPLATAIFAEYPWSTVGSYLEVAQVLSCRYKSRDMLFAAQFHVTTAAAMAAGREIAGFPKKIGDIGFEFGEMYFSYLDRPTGLRVCSANFTPTTEVHGDLPFNREYVSLRVIPNPMDDPKPGEARNPSLAQLIGSEWQIGPGQLWDGVGSCHFTGASEHDPYHALPILQTVKRSLFIGKMSAKRITFMDNL